MKECGRLKIAGLNIFIKSNEKISSLGMGIGREDKFFSDSSPNLNLELTHLSPPAIEGRKIFDSEGAWQLYDNSQGYVLSIPGLPRKISRLLQLNRDLTKGRLYIDRYAGQREPLALEHPLLQILLTLWLSRKAGVTVHACGIKERDEGILFLGSSGSGKSTMARLWHREGAVILSDERVVIQKNHSLYHLYGTPWAGQARMCSPYRVPLKKVFFIKPAKENAFFPLKSPLALSKALVLSYLPIWDRTGMTKTIDFLAGLFKAIPAYSLNFKPDRKLIELVRSVS